MVTTARRHGSMRPPTRRAGAHVGGLAHRPRNAAVPLRAARFAASGRDYTGAVALARHRGRTVSRSQMHRGARRGPAAARDVGGRAGSTRCCTGATLARASEVAGSLKDVRQQYRVRRQQAILDRKTGDVVAAAKLTTEAVDFGAALESGNADARRIVRGGQRHVIATSSARRRRCSSASEASPNVAVTTSTRARAYLSLA